MYRVYCEDDDGLITFEENFITLQEAAGYCRQCNKDYPWLNFYVESGEEQNE